MRNAPLSDVSSPPAAPERAPRPKKKTRNAGGPRNAAGRCVSSWAWTPKPVNRSTTKRKAPDERPGGCSHMTTEQRLQIAGEYEQVCKRYGVTPYGKIAEGNELDISVKGNSGVFFRFPWPIKSFIMSAADARLLATMIIEQAELADLQEIVDEFGDDDGQPF